MLVVHAVAQVDVRERVGACGGRGRAVAMAVAVAAMIMYDEHAHDVKAEPDTANDHDLLGVVDGLDVDETFEGLEEDGERQCQEEDAVEEGALEGG